VLLGNGTCWDSTVFFDDTDTTIGNCSVDQSCSSIIYDTDLPLENQTLVSCSNISGSVSDLCTVTSGSGTPDGNVSSICSDNEVLLGQDTTLCTSLNDTIDDRDSDTTYTNSTGLSLVGTTFSVILSYFQGLFIELTDSFGGEVSGTYDAIVLDHDALDDQYVELTDLPLENQTLVSCSNVTGSVSDLCTVTSGSGTPDG